jgi:hypothetical protein
LGKLSLPGSTAGHSTGTVQVNGIFGRSFGTYSETCSIHHSGVASASAKTGPEVEDSVGGSCYTGTLAYTFRDTVGLGGRTDGGVGDGVSCSASSKVEVGVDTESLYVVRYAYNEK